MKPIDEIGSGDWVVEHCVVHEFRIQCSRCSVQWLWRGSLISNRDCVELAAQQGWTIDDDDNPICGVCTTKIP